MGYRPLRSEREARRRASLEENRRWLVASAASVAQGHPTGFILVPGENTVPYSQPGSPVRRRAGFLDHHFWATLYKPAERHAAGEYPNQAPGGDGLPRWSEDDEALEGRDLVVWYTLGVTHTPRPEEWPVMPVHRASVRLIPIGFFPRNPALGLSREAPGVDR